MTRDKKDLPKGASLTEAVPTKVSDLKKPPLDQT